MRRHPVSAHHVFRLRWIVAAFLLTCFVASVYAGVRVNASGIRSTGATATGVRTTAVLEATFTGSINGVKTYGVPVPVSSSTLGTLAKSAMRKALPAYGWYQVAKGLIDGAGWAINELQQQVIVPGTKQELDLQGWCRGTNCAATIDGLIPFVQGQYSGENYPDSRWIAIEQSSTTGLICYRITGTQGCRVSAPVALVSRPVNGWDGYTNVGPGTDARQVTDEELGQLLKQSPQVVNAILIDPETGAPIRTQELVDAMNDLRRQLEAANGLAPGTDVPPTDDPAKPEVRESEWPGFCDWATTVCDFVGWVKDDKSTEEVELPETELEIKTSEWSSGVGGGSCPAAEVITVSFAGTSGDVTFDWQPVCKGATLLRPFLIAVSTMVAAFIVAGLRKSAL